MELQAVPKISKPQLIIGESRTDDCPYYYLLNTGLNKFLLKKLFIHHDLSQFKNLLWKFPYTTILLMRRHNLCAGWWQQWSSLMTDMPTFALSCGRSSFPTSKFLGLPVYLGFFTSFSSILLPSWADVSIFLITCKKILIWTELILHCNSKMWT